MQIKKLKKANKHSIAGLKRPENKQIRQEQIKRAIDQRGLASQDLNGLENTKKIMKRFKLTKTNERGHAWLC